MTSKPTLKSMEPTKTDLLRALCTLEGELQAKDIVISILKTEQVRRLIHPCYNKRRWTQPQPHSKVSTDTIIPNNRALKCKQLQLQQQQNIQHQDSTTSQQQQHNQQSPSSLQQLQPAYKSVQLNVDPSDPFIALLRDTYCAYDPSYDESSTKLIYNLQYQNLRNLIDQQRRVRHFLESQIADWEVKYKVCWQELESEKTKSAKYERDKMILEIERLEKENDSLKIQVENVKSDLEKEKEREKSMVMCLVTERKELICRLIEHEQHNNTLIDMLAAEQCRSAEMSEDLEEESKRSLQMESELERLTASYEKSKVHLLDKINNLENRSTKLEEENEKLKKELETIKSKRLAQLGEGVRSTIVTVNSTDHKVVPSVTSSVAAANQPKVNVARPVSPSRVISSGLVAATGGPSISPLVTTSSVSSSRSTTAGQISTVSSSTPMTTTTTSSSTYASIQPILKTGTNHATIPVNPITSTPPTGPPPSKSTPAVTPQSTTPAAASPSTNSTVTPDKARRAKVMTPASGSPQTPVQKKVSPGPVTGSGSGASPVFRGAPPPIPPNKPILPANALKERSKEIQQATVRAKLMTAKPITASLSSSSSTPVPVQGEPLVNDKSPSSSSTLSPSVMVNGTIKRKEKILTPSINSSSSTDTPSPSQQTKEINLTTSDTNNKLPSVTKNLNDPSEIKQSVGSVQESSTDVEMISREIDDFQNLLTAMISTTIYGSFDSNYR